MIPFIRSTDSPIVVFEDNGFDITDPLENIVLCILIKEIAKQISPKTYLAIIGNITYYVYSNEDRIDFLVKLVHEELSVPKMDIYKTAMSLDLMTDYDVSYNFIEFIKKYKGIIVNDVKILIRGKPPVDIVKLINKAINFIRN